MSDPLKSWRPLLARVPLVVSLLAAVWCAGEIYYWFSFEDEASRVALALTAALVGGGITRLFIWLSPNFMLGALLGGMPGLALSIILDPGLGDAGAIASLGVLGIGAALGVTLALKYKVW